MAAITIKHKKFNFERLTTFGFQKTEQHYTYQVPIVDNQFLLTVTAMAPNLLSTHVTDTSTNTEYVLHLAPHAHGKFVGKVAAAYQQVLTQIETNCMDTDVFQAAQAQALISHIQQTYGDQLEFLWKKFPENAIWRRSDNRKWYALLLTISKTKLGLTTDEPVTVLDLRVKPEMVAELVDHVTYFPGYHMNKRNWITLMLDGSVPMATIVQRLETSYQLAK